MNTLSANDVPEREIDQDGLEELSNAEDNVRGLKTKSTESRLEAKMCNAKVDSLYFCYQFMLSSGDPLGVRHECGRRSVHTGC